jgi:glycosidase
MTLARTLAGTLFFGATVLATWSLPGCGSDQTNNKDFGQPPDAGLFNPGNGGSDGYGSGGAVTPFVCPPELKRCSHTFTYPFNNETSVELRGDFGGPDTWVTGKPMVHQGAVWTVDVNVPYNAPVQYKFFLNGTTWTYDPAQKNSTDANQNTNNVFDGATCDPAICEEEGALPPGVYDWRDSVIYFTFVDRFFNGDPSNDCDINGVSGGTKSIANYQGGDWAGITQKINAGYFTDLGVNTLWVTVPFDNPNVTGQGVGGDTHQYSGYHGYWPKIDSSNPATLAAEECFGTLTDLKALVTAAHAKGLKVLFDYAMVHVHNSSALYQAHQNDGWFWPNNNGSGGDCICGQGCSWDDPVQQKQCWFTSYLPHWNYTTAAARDYSVTNAVEWVKQTGVDGFRADAIKHVDISWLTTLRARIASDVLATQTPQQRFYMVGETYDFGNRDLIKSYVDPATKLDGQFDFPLRAQVVSNVIMRLGSMSDLANFMNSNDYYYGANAVMSTFIGNHDLPRIIHLAADNRIWGDNQGADGKDRAWANQPGLVAELSAYERVANGFAVLFTNRGAPLVYYGDEIGLPGAGDPDNRRFMQWPGSSQLNSAALTANQQFLHDRVAKLLDIRAKHPALRRGVRTTISTTNDVWVYSRITTGDTVYVAINRGDTDQSISGLPTGQLDELVTGTVANGPNTSVPARQTRIFVAK